MSDEYEDESEDKDPVVQLRRSEIRALEKKAAKATEAEALRQENIVLKALAGKELTAKQMKALVAAHDGDWDAESVKATATELNFITEPKPEAEDAQTAEDAAALERMADGAAHATSLPTGVAAAAERVIAANSEDAFWAEAEAAGFVK